MYAGLLLVMGGALLMAGAEALVRGSSRLALTLGISPMVVGLTVVAFGTSMPELAASMAAQLEDRGGIALGNIVGSNIANVGLILAIAGLILPVPVLAMTIRKDLPMLAAATLLFAGMLALDGELGRVEGMVLLVGLALFTWEQVRLALRERTEVKEEYQEATAAMGHRWSPVQCGVAIVLGLVLLVGGAQLLVEGAVTLARALGISERVIGLTIVAVGTSLPELAATVTATLKKEVDVAVGNVIGSNMFNILGIGGAVALVKPIPAPQGMTGFDVPVLLGSTALLFLFLWTGRVLTRLEAVVLLVTYGVYLALLF